jgi:hypothetical protein
MRSHADEPQNLITALATFPVGTRGITRDEPRQASGVLEPVAIDPDRHCGYELAHRVTVTRRNVAGIDVAPAALV